MSPNLVHLATEPPRPHTNHLQIAREQVLAPDDGWGEEYVAASNRYAQANATIALVEAQRTANQLAYAALLPESSPTRKRILDDVEARLAPTHTKEQ